jgi:DNA replication protein DnaC
MFKNTLSPRNQQNYEKEFKKEFNFDLSKSYFIHGNAGVGKTFQSIQFVKFWLEKELIKEEYESRYVKFCSFLDLVKIARKASTKDNEEGYVARSNLKFIKEVELLVLDDLGVEKHTDFIQETVYDVISYRYEGLLQTIITSNFDLSEIGEKYHSRIASRIGGMCEIVKPKNQKDLRITNHFHNKT